MEVKSTNFWWLKNKPPSNDVELNRNVSGNCNVSTNSLVDLFDKEAENLKERGSSNVDVDVGSIIEEINRVAAQSPLGPYEANTGGRSVDELMKEAEKIYMESSKSFEQLSQKSKTSQNISELSLNSKDSTPTPKSLSPLPLDTQKNDSERNNDENDDSEFYSEDFSDESKTESTPSIENNLVLQTEINERKQNFLEIVDDENYGTPKHSFSIELNNCDTDRPLKKLVQSKSETTFQINDQKHLEQQLEFERKRRELEMKQLSLKDNLIQALEEDNQKLKRDIEDIKLHTHLPNLICYTLSYNQNYYM
ncbi:hypothetical protein WA026_010855 [Henosepilachna vigintioctopunctata]|uniref:Uncharacterized protein n=1 Tax=Henosepilachna vigintioctopunctata TaxID=420089 RepID=A0AAW1V0J7_9CUCU